MTRASNSKCMGSMVGMSTVCVRRILEDGGKLYTQIKIDEITNLGAVNIRLRSLLGALEQKEKEG